MYVLHEQIYAAGMTHYCITLHNVAHTCVVCILLHRWLAPLHLAFCDVNRQTPKRFLTS